MTQPSKNKIKLSHRSKTESDIHGKIHILLGLKISKLSAFDAWLVSLTDFKKIEHKMTILMTARSIMLKVPRINFNLHATQMDKMRNGIKVSPLHI